MAEFKIKHDRPNCIGCGACAAVFPDKWFMEEDGKSSVRDCSKTSEGWEELAFDDNEYDNHKAAADSCPVNVIHVHKKENDEKII